MIIKITLKDPDALIEGINDSLSSLHIEGLEDDELEDLKDKRRQEYLDLCSKWFEYGEYITVEIDTELATCKVPHRE